MSGSHPGCFWAHPCEAKCRTGGFALNTGRFVPPSGAPMIWRGPLLEAGRRPTALDTGDVPLWGGGPSTGKESWAGCDRCGSVRFCGLCTCPHPAEQKINKKPPRRLRDGATCGLLPRMRPRPGGTAEWEGTQPATRTTGRRAAAAYEADHERGAFCKDATKKQKASAAIFEM